MVALAQLAESVAVARTGALDELPIARSHGALAGGETGRRPAYSPAGRGGAPRGASMGLRPVGAVAYVHLEGDAEGEDALHGVPHGRLDGREPVGRDLQQELVVDLEEEARPAPSGAQAAPDLEHGELDQVGGRALDRRVGRRPLGELPHGGVAGPELGEVAP